MKNCIIVFVSVFYLWYENNFLPFRHIIIMQKKKKERRKTTIKINVFLAAIKGCLYVFVPETNMIRLYLSIIWNISEINFKYGEIMVTHFWWILWIHFTLKLSCLLNYETLSLYIIWIHKVTFLQSHYKTENTWKFKWFHGSLEKWTWYPGFF